jgi:predicted RNase H-like nuclease
MPGNSKPWSPGAVLPAPVRFLGIDLGWQSGPSGVCCLTWHQNQLALTDLDRYGPVDEILAWVEGYTQDLPTAVVAVDAPTLIPNQTGMRLPDRLAHKYFGQYDAGCYPANRSRPFAEKLLAFGLALEARGFRHAPEAAAQSPGKFQLEVFPHPVTVHLFNLQRILKYKKGTLAQRRPELEKLRRYQLEILPGLDPPLSLTATDLPEIPTTGAAMKAVEDQLDSLTCAYAAAHWWYWGQERNWVLGSVEEGYIVGPGRKEQLGR